MAQNPKTALKKLLLARDAASIAQGVELVISLGDEAIIDELLAGVSYDPARTSAHERNGHPGGAVVPNRTFTGNGREQPWFSHALLSLISKAPGARATALRQQITHLTIDARSIPHCDLSDYAGLVALERVSFDGESAAIGSLGALPKLRELKVNARRISELGAIPSAPSLEHLDLSGRLEDGIAALAGSRVTSAHILDHDLGDLTALRKLPNLVELSLAAADYSGLDGARIERLTIWNGDRELSHLGSLPELRELTLSGGIRGLTAAPKLRKLIARKLDGAPALPELVELWADLDDQDVRLFGGFPKLEEVGGWLWMSSWSGFARLPSLRRITASHVSKLESTAGVPAGVEIATGREQLSFNESRSSLVSVRDLGGVRGFRHLSLYGCSNLTSLDGLQGSQITSLDLTGCTALTDVSALADVPGLRAIGAYGCGASDESFPAQHRWAITRSRAADVARLAKRDPPTKVHVPAGEVDAAAWSELTVQLQQGHVDAAADRVRAAGIALYERLLQGASVVVADGSIRAPKVPVVGRTPQAQHLFRRLVAEAPDECAVATKIRSRMVRLSIDAKGRGRDRWRQKPPPVDLAPLARFPHLREVEIEDAAELVNVETVRTCKALTDFKLKTSDAALPDLGFAVGTALQRLEIGILGSLRSLDATEVRELTISNWGTGEWPDMATAGTCPKIESLHGVRLVEPDALDAFPNLTALSCTRPDHRVHGLRHARLAKLSVRPAISVRDLQGLTSLTDLVLRTGSSDPPISDIAGLPVTLERLILGRLAPDFVFEGASKLRALRALHLDTVDGQGLAWAAALPALTHIVLGYESSEIEPLLSLPNLVELHISNPRRLGSRLAVLDKHPTLERVICRDQSHVPARLRSTAAS
jgi:hypothetical protein